MRNTVLVNLTYNLLVLVKPFILPLLATQTTIPIVVRGIEGCLEWGRGGADAEGGPDPKDVNPGQNGGLVA